MKYTQETQSYNERRYGKPWVASITFDDSGKAIFKFGNWIGEHGLKGLLELEVNDGDIVATGQKDNRKPRNSAPDYFIFSGGELTAVSKLDAYKHFRSIQQSIKG